jgi:murein peptide amidase A
VQTDGRQKPAKWENHVSVFDIRTSALPALIALLLILGGLAEAAMPVRTGRSVEGRSIISYRLGPAAAVVKVLVFGDIHGNEGAGMRIARRLLTAAPPGQVQIIVVPTINPDGAAAGTRGNAHGVDLNRNFPFRWRPLDGGEYSGTGPLSEPESRAAHRLILRRQPDVTIWFHQPFGLVDCPEGNPFAARRYAQLIGLPLVRLPGPYPGSASRWQNHRFPNSIAFVVELPRHVDGALVRRGASAVRALAAELASPAVEAGRPAA